MVYHTDLRLQEVLYVLVFYIMSFSWLLSLNGFKFIFLWRDSENDHCASDKDEKQTSELCTLFISPKNVVQKSSDSKKVFAPPVVDSGFLKGGWLT